ncbi:MAG TPA: BON domain-containing protein [Pirellulaceae bacterium]|nr:BON domain-containing protein [Pirellulaceae bacterium]
MSESPNLTLDLTDVDLERRVLSYLMQRQVPALRRITVAVQGGVVTLTGRVQSFYERQLCLSCCQRVAGVRQLVDLIEVVAA